MQYSQTRYRDSLQTGINDTDLSLICASVTPTRTGGILTIGRVQANTEDVLYDGIAGNSVIILLRGLSQTALTPTTVVGNRKVHVASESLEITTHHLYDADKLRKSENDTVTGTITFSGNNNSFTGTGNSFANAPKVPGIADTFGNRAIDITPNASAVNELVVQNSSVGSNVIVTAAGNDANINVEYQGKGFGRPILQDGSLTKTSAAPTVDNGIANKKYVDDKSLTTQQLLAPTTDLLGENFSASDITNNLNLAYQSATDGRWYKVNSSGSTWLNRPLGIVLDSGNTGDSGKRILLRGNYTGLAFPNINPVFSSTSTGVPSSVGLLTLDYSAIAFVVSNTNGAEAIVTGGTVRARQIGTPSGDLLINLVLEGTDTSTNYPAAYKDTTNNVLRGAIIATASIPQVNFSAAFQTMPFTFTPTLGASAVKIPAKSRVYMVFTKGGALNDANYYDIDSNAQTAVLSQTSQTWSLTANSGNITLNAVSTSPVGYSVKAYTGSNGSYGIVGSSIWSKAIGFVTKSNEFYFNPRPSLTSKDLIGIQAVPTAASGINLINTGFCPNQVSNFTTTLKAASANLNLTTIGTISSEISTSASQQFSSIKDGSNTVPVNGTGGTLGSLATTGKQVLNGLSSAAASQNNFQCARLETGYFVYITFPSGTNFLSAGTAGSTAGFSVLSSLDSVQ